jgi:hypothetical protein
MFFAPGGETKILWPKDKDCSKAPGAGVAGAQKLQRQQQQNQLPPVSLY